MPRNRAAEAVRKARKSREDPSVAEEIMWSFLRNGKLGYKFRREHPAGPMRPDKDAEPMREYVQMPREVLDNLEAFLFWVERSANYARKKVTAPAA